MGNSPSRRRRSENHVPLPPHHHPHAFPPPHGYISPPCPVTYHPYLPTYDRGQMPYYQPTSFNGAMVAPLGPHFYQPGSLDGGGWQQYPAIPPTANGYWSRQPSSVVSQHAPVEQQQTTTIRNDVNVKKGTISLVEDDANPGYYLATFSFDATTAGSISIFYFAKEGANCSLTSLKSDTYKPVKVYFSEGFGQKFQQPQGTGVQLSQFESFDLTHEGPDEIYPLVIRAETVSKNAPVESAGTKTEDVIGAALPKWVNSQITQAVIDKKGDADYKVRVLQQIIWVDGVRYELQEIYGIESSTGGCEYDDDDFGKECVICMSEPRNITVLPCRHMCMCRGCANVVKYQMERCPICRQKVDKLLEIKVKS